MPLEDTDIRRDLTDAIIRLVGTQIQITDDLDQTALLDAGLLHPIGDVLACGAVEERGVVLISIFCVDHKSECAVVSILSALDLRIGDQTALHNDGCVHNPFPFCLTA